MLPEHSATAVNALPTTSATNARSTLSKGGVVTIKLAKERTSPELDSMSILNAGSASAPAGKPVVSATQAVTDQSPNALACNANVARSLDERIVIRACDILL
jgi:hypothetical protein